MLPLIILWLALFSLSFGVLAFVFLSMTRAAGKPWSLEIDESFRPRVSIIIPTYNESRVIRYKLENLAKVEYERDLMQVLVADSNSSDLTVSIVNDFVRQHPEIQMQVLVQHERKGKSNALNFALRKCTGDLVIVSDADCFWPSDILNKSLPFLADPDVGAISGPKSLLNPAQSWTTRIEDTYLKSVNTVKLGESKTASTLLFEGGFSAYKREVIDAFDPYNTGSDDSGTIIKIIEGNNRAILVPEAEFFSAFPTTWKGRLGIKIRRANQLVRLFSRYAVLLLQGRLDDSKRIVYQNVFVYLVSPLMLILLLMTTISLLTAFPYFAAVLVALLIPRVRTYLVEGTQNYFVLFLAIVLAILGKKTIVWDQPAGRDLVTEEMLCQRNLI